MAELGRLESKVLLLSGKLITPTRTESLPYASHIIRNLSAQEVSKENAEFGKLEAVSLSLI